ncbi:MAG TPA: LEA type 2 family protein [Polyangiaceae bacterium]|nr:LEA type 2 family protein [Polyangiaceae bacterium]
MNAPRSSIAAAALCGLALGCAVQRPSVLPQAVRIEGVDLAGVVVRTDMDVFNPNTFSLNVAAVSGSLTLAGQVPLGSAAVPTASHLPARSWQHVTADLHLPWLNLPGVLALASTQSVVAYTFDGSATIGGRLRVTIPFQIRGEVAAAELMRAGVSAPFGAATGTAPGPVGFFEPRPRFADARLAPPLAALGGHGAPPAAP